MSAPDPDTVNVPPPADELPVTPTAPTSVLVHPAGSAALRATSSIDAVALCETSWLETARPAQRVPVIVIVCWPMFVHTVPSDDIDAVINWPARVSRSQRGAAPETPVRVLTPPLALLRTKATPLPGVTSTDA